MAGGGSSDTEAELQLGFKKLGVTRSARRPSRRSHAPQPSLTASPSRACTFARASSSAVPGACSPRTRPTPSPPPRGSAARDMQAALAAVELCRKPVVAAMHGACDIRYCSKDARRGLRDIRYCSKDATFVLKEVDMTIVADLDALQRLPRIIG